MKMGKIPQLLVVGDYLPEVWEKSVITLWEKGMTSTKESYKIEGGKDVIRESTMSMVIRKPLEQPMVHMGYEGVLSLDEYVKDVLEGTKDYLIGKGYDYTYHKQLFEFAVITSSGVRPAGVTTVARVDGSTAVVNVDQIAQIIKKLKEAPMSNRAQAITWMPWKHYDVAGPPCLQRIWCKVIDGELEMHTHWRSRDAYHAAFANMFAFIHLQKLIADKLKVKVGQHVDISDSYHVYGQFFPSVEKFLTATTMLPKETRWVHADKVRL